MQKKKRDIRICVNKDCKKEFLSLSCHSAVTEGSINGSLMNLRVCRVVS